MFCGNCGTEVSDGAQFCHGCGAQLAAEAPVQPPVAEPVQEPAKAPKPAKKPKAAKAPGKKPGKGLIVAVAAVVVLALVITLVAGLFGGAKAKVGKALLKSGNAFASALEDTNLTGLGELLTKKELSQDVSVWVDKIDGSTEFKGAGVRVSLDSSISDRKIALSATPYFGSADLINAQLKIDNEKIYIGSPELTKDSYYMINTTTIGKDVEDLLGMDELGDLSFNLFDVSNELSKIAKSNKDLEKTITKAGKNFIKAIEVEKGKAETIEVNEKDLKCTPYHVVITEDAMDELLDALEEAYGTVDNTDAYLDLLESIGMPDEVNDELEYALENSTEGMEESFEVLHDAVDELGDIELDLYINKGYVVAVVYELSFDGMDAELTLNIGGNKNYVDDISMTLAIDDGELSVVSTGNHTGKGGEYTDETVVKMKTGKNKQTLAEMELTYAPKAKSDNFELTVKAGGEKITAEGQVTCSSSAMNIRLEKIKVSDFLTFGVEYSIGKYEGDQMKVKNIVALAELSEDDLMEEGEKISENAMEWAEKLMEEYPDLAYLLY